MRYLNAVKLIAIFTFGGYGFNLFVLRPQRALQEIPGSPTDSKSDTSLHLNSTDQAVVLVAKYFQESEVEKLTVSGRRAQKSYAENNSSIAASIAAVQGDGEDSDFNQEFIDGIRSERIRNLMKEANDNRLEELAIEVDKVLLDPDNKEVTEKLKLLEVKNWLDTKKSIKTNAEVYVQEAGRYFNSTNPSEAQYAKVGIHYYLDSEPDANLRNQRYQKFLSEAAAKAESNER